ncbi:hypothetical protein Aduo_006834 [Ancylostoma duodenale]
MLTNVISLWRSTNNDVDAAVRISDKLLSCLNVGIVYLLLLGAAVAGIITGVFKPDYKGKVIHFAIHLGKGGAIGPAPVHSESRIKAGSKKCNIWMNVDNTRNSILAMEDLEQRYSFILYESNAGITESLGARDAIDILNKIRPTSAEQFSQTSAITEFEVTVRERTDDLLIYYIPCNYQYNESDADTKSFVAKMGKHQGRVLLASNTQPAALVAKAFNQSREYVVGEGEDILERILRFCTQNSATSVLTTTSTTYRTLSTGKTSPTLRSVSVTKPTSTKGSSPSTEVKPTTTSSATTGHDETSTKQTPTTSERTVPTTYTSSPTSILPSSTTKISSTTEQTIPTISITENVLSSTTLASTSMKTTTTTTELSTSTENRDSPTTEGAISTKTTAGTTQVTSTTKNLPTTTTLASTRLELTTLTAQPTTNLSPSTRISSPSTKSTTITNTVSPSTKEISSSGKTTMSTKPPATTTVTTGRDLHCLFAADLLNYGFIPAAYERETDFTIKIGEALFERVPMFSAGIWVYGFTRSPPRVTITSETMRSNVTKFREDVTKKVILEHDIEESNTDNRRVITSLNNCMDKDRRANCLVFLSALEDTTVWNNCESCKLNVTKDAYFETIVAVSLRSKNLSSIIIPPRGKYVGVSRNSEEDVLKVVNKILEN